MVSRHESSSAGSSQLATLVRVLRERALLTQEELARRSGVSVSTVRGVESGRIRRPRIGSLRLLVDILADSEEERAALVAAAGAEANRGRLDLESRSEGMPAVPVPRQLPLAPAWLAGRGDEVARLEAALGTPGDAAAVVIASISGPGGVGKSALAIHTAHRLTAVYPDGHLYVDLQGATAGLPPLEPIEVLARFLRSLGAVPGSLPSQVDEAAALFRSRLAGRRVLVLLDNAVDEGQVRRLLPGSPGCGVVITSRRTLSGVDGSQIIHLDVLAPRDAVELLDRLVSGGRVNADPPAAAALARWCGYLPLALRIAAARLAARPDRAVSTLNERLADEHRRLDELEHGDVGVRSSLAVSHGYLQRSADPADRAAATAFVLLAVWEGPDLDECAATQLLGASGSGVSTLDRLVDARLVDTRRRGRYHLHDLLRLYARERAREALPKTDHVEAVRRLLCYYVTCAWHTLALVRPGNERLVNMDPSWLADGRRFADQATAIAWLEEERINLLAAVAQAASTEGLEGAAVQLAQGLFGFLPVRGYWRDWQRVNEIALAAAVKTGDLAAEARALNDLGGAFYIQGHHAEAQPRLRRGLDLFRQLGDRRAEASILGNLGLTYEYQGRIDDALRCAEQSHALYRDLGDRHGEANSTANLGTLSIRRGRLDEALTRTTRALAIYRELDERVNQARCLNTIGEVYRLQNRLGDAIDYVSASLFINEDVGNRQGYADNLNVLGEIHGLQGRHEEALIHFRRSVTIFRELGGRQDEADALRRTGEALLALGRREEACDQWRAALEICEELALPDADHLRELIAGSARSRR